MTLAEIIKSDANTLKLFSPAALKTNIHAGCRACNLLQLAKNQKPISKKKLALSQFGIYTRP